MGLKDWTPSLFLAWWRINQRVIVLCYSVLCLTLLLSARSYMTSMPPVSFVNINISRNVMVFSHPRAISWNISYLTIPGEFRRQFDIATMFLTGLLLMLPLSMAQQSNSSQSVISAFIDVGGSPRLLAGSVIAVSASKTTIEVRCHTAEASRLGSGCPFIWNETVTLSGATAVEGHIREPDFQVSWTCNYSSAIPWSTR